MRYNPFDLIPSIAWLRSYRKDWLRLDVIAGLTAAAVVIPKAMAYATIAGLPVQVGLYTAFVPMVVYALLGTSRALSVSTTTTIAILAAAELGRAVPGATRRRSSRWPGVGTCSGSEGRRGSAGRRPHRGRVSAGGAKSGLGGSR